LNKVFLKESTGTIWAFKPRSEGSNTDQGDTFILISSPVPAMNSISNELVDAFEPGDQRKEKWIGQYSEGANTWYFPYKYKVRGNIGDGVNKEYPIMFRLGEQYLIRSEARAQQENILGAQQDLNKIRTRAGLSDTEAATRISL